MSNNNNPGSAADMSNGKDERDSTDALSAKRAEYYPGRRVSRNEIIAGLTYELIDGKLYVAKENLFDHKFADDGEEFVWNEMTFEEAGFHIDDGDEQTPVAPEMTQSSDSTEPPFSKNAANKDVQKETNSVDDERQTAGSVSNLNENDDVATAPKSQGNEGINELDPKSLRTPKEEEDTETVSAEPRSELTLRLERMLLEKRQKRSAKPKSKSTFGKLAKKK